MSQNSMTFTFSNATQSQIDGVCHEFNAQVTLIKSAAGIPYRTYPQANRATGLACMDSVTIRTMNGSTDEGLPDLDLAAAEVILKSIAQDQNLKFSK